MKLMQKSMEKRRYKSPAAANLIKPPYIAQTGETLPASLYSGFTELIPPLTSPHSRKHQPTGNRSIRWQPAMPAKSETKTR
jgi:hypothetical protein